MAMIVASTGRSLVVTASAARYCPSREQHDLADAGAHRVERRPPGARSLGVPSKSQPLTSMNVMPSNTSSLRLATTVPTTLA
jgi:hypothetical protein